MPRKSNVASNYEDKRLEIIHQHQSKLRKQLSRDLASKKVTRRLPGEENFKKNMAIFLKIGVPGISYTEIGARIGETKTAVKSWFATDTYVREQYEVISKTLKDSALDLMEFYAIEAVETLVLLMRFGEEKIMLESAKEILDRIGIAKLSKSESEIKTRREVGWEDQTKLLEDIRTLPPDKQEEAVKTLEGLQSLLAGEEVEGAIVSEEDADEFDAPPPIVGRSDEDLIEDDDDASI